MKHKFIGLVIAASLLLSGCAGVQPSQEFLDRTENVLSYPNLATEKVVSSVGSVVHEKVSEELSKEFNVAGCEASATNILGSIGKAVGVLALTTTPTAIPAVLSVLGDYTYCASGASSKPEPTSHVDSRPQVFGTCMGAAPLTYCTPPTTSLAEMRAQFGNQDETCLGCRTWDKR